MQGSMFNKTNQIRSSTTEKKGLTLEERGDRAYHERCISALSKVHRYASAKNLKMNVAYQVEGGIDQV